MTRDKSPGEPPRQARKRELPFNVVLALARERTPEPEGVRSGKPQPQSHFGEGGLSARPMWAVAPLGGNLDWDRARHGADSGGLMWSAGGAPSSRASRNGNARPSQGSFPERARQLSRDHNPSGAGPATRLGARKFNKLKPLAGNP